MRALLIVLFSPTLHKSSRLLQANEEVFVEAFISEFSVKTLDISILVGFSWLNVVPPHTFLLTPFEDRYARKFGAVITQNSGRLTTNLDDLLQF